MGKAVIRRIVINDKLYLWRRTHRYIKENARWQCEERLKVFADGLKKSPLQIIFCERAGWLVGYQAQGIVWRAADATSYNLNRPAIVKTLVLFMLKHGWNPETGKPLQVENGVDLLLMAGVPAGFE